MSEQNHLVVVRPAALPGDRAAARSLMEDYLDGFPLGDDGGRSPGQVQALAAFPESFAGPGAAVVLAWAGPVPAVGLGCLRPHRGPVPSAAEIKHLFVRPLMRRQGVGMSLTSHLIGVARAAGARHVLLDTDSSSGPALRLYQRLGFVPCAPFNDGWPTAVHLALRLEQSRSAS